MSDIIIWYSVFVWPREIRDKFSTWDRSFFESELYPARNRERIDTFVCSANFVEEDWIRRSFSLPFSVFYHSRMVTHSMDNILNMQYYPTNSHIDISVHSPPPRKRRCLNKEVNIYFRQFESEIDISLLLRVRRKRESFIVTHSQSAPKCYHIKRTFLPHIYNFFIWFGNDFSFNEFYILIIIFNFPCKISITKL